MKFNALKFLSRPETAAVWIAAFLSSVSAPSAAPDGANPPDDRFLAPRSRVSDLLFEDEARRVFLRNLEHGGILAEFHYSDIVMGATGLSSLVGTLPSTKRFLDSSFAESIQDHNRSLFRLDRRIRDLVKNIHAAMPGFSAWREFVRLTDRVLEDNDEMLSSIRMQHDRLVSTYPRDSGAMEAARTLTSIEQGLERLSDILRQTRLIVEDPQALHRSFSTRDLIEKVRSRWPARSFSFKDAIEVRPGALNLGRIDSSELFVLNALANLAENADRYKNNRIAVVVEPDFGTGELVFRFENDAETLPPSVFVLSHGREKIFDLGYTTRGTGVGTALVWHTARILGHRVRFRNSKEGVVFEYRIPVFSQDRLLPAPLRYLPNRAPVRTHPAERAA